MAELSAYDNDPTIYLFTSLTAGSSHIVTATSRIETILRANKVPFRGVDTATDDLARKLFQRRAAGKKLPLVVKEGYVLGGIEEIEEWNEYDELREALGVTSEFTAMPAKPTSLFEPAPSKTPPPLAASLPGGFSASGPVGGAANSIAGSLSEMLKGSTATGASSSSSSGTKGKENTPMASAEQNLAIRQMGAEAAKIAAAKKPVPTKIATTNPLLAEKISPASQGNMAGSLDALLSDKAPKSPAAGAGASAGASAAAAPPAVKTTGLDKANDAVLSPREVPLPETPKIPLAQSQTVNMPPSMHVGADDPKLTAGPIKSSQAAETKESSGESEEDEESEESEEVDAKVEEKEVEKKEKKVEETKPAAKATEAESSEEESEEEESEEESDEPESKPVTPAPAATKPAVADTKPAAAPTKPEAELKKESSPEDETSEEESSEDEPHSVAKTPASASAPTAPTPKPAPPTASSKKGEEEEDDDDDDDDEEESSEDDGAATKTQEQGAKDAVKAGESVKD
jgi:hypothetical protein